MSKLLVYPLITPIVIPYITPQYNPPLRSLDYGSYRFGVSHSELGCRGFGGQALGGKGPEWA